MLGNVFLKEFEVKKVFYNRDYEPYATKRDAKISAFCKGKGAAVFNFKDQVVFEKNEITKTDGLPYLVYTPYKKRWLLEYSNNSIQQFPSEKLSSKFLKEAFYFPALKEIGFGENKIQVLPINSKCINNYVLYRDTPSVETSNISVHLRFGTISVRSLMAYAIKTDATFTSELIWREFFMQILYHFPKVVNENFKAKYNYIQWRNNEAEFKLWCDGKTGYPIVDAGMRN